VSHVNAGKVVAIHHGLELFNGSVDEQRGVRAARATPNNIRRCVMVPICGLSNNPGAFDSGCHVRFDGQNALSFRQCIFLVTSAKTSLVFGGSWGATFISPTAATSLMASRATITTLAPFAASWHAALRPSPLEPPVSSTVCSLC